MADNLIQKKGESTWYVRLAVPADIQSAMGGTVLIQSLKTGLRSEAMTRRLSILAGWKAQFRAAREKRSNREDGWKDRIAADADDFTKIFRGLKTAAALGESSPPLINLDPDDLEEFRQFVFNDSESGRRRQAEAEAAYALQGLDKEMALHDLAHKALMETLGELIAYKNDFSGAEAEQMQAIFADPTAHKVKSPITKQRIATFRQYREARGVATKTIDQQQSKLKKLAAYLAKEDKTLDFDAVSDWLDSLKLASKTLTQYLLAGNVFWKWAMKHDMRWREDFKGRENPFESHELPQARGKERIDRQRKDFQPKEIAELHAAALAADQTTLGDLILLGAYTGARIEELCRLRVEHLIEPDGVYSFDIIDSKTAAGIRVVPVHPALTAIIDRLKRDSTDGYLVPSYSKNKYGIRSDALSKAFGRLKEAHGYGGQHVFHSIRKTVITQLVRAGVQGTLIAELVGHETGTVTFDVYSQGASSVQKLKAISKLSLPSLG